jgi:mannose-6-phosphate isomerase-like protein (cupin superfamily)
MCISECEKRFDRPWGYYEILSDFPDHKVKRIVVYPNNRLSLQTHKFRIEHWIVISGEGTALVEDKEYALKTNSVIDIPCKSRHRLHNYSNQNLVIIEVQTGEYFGEDDIQRYEDDYGRIG